MSNFHIEIVTPEKKVYDSNAISLIVPAYEGYLGIKSKHAPLIASLQPGAIQLVDENETKYFTVSGGFIEVNNNKVIILADAVEAIDGIDIERARDSLKRAKAKLKGAATDDEYQNAISSIKRAENRLRLAEKFSADN